jgi:hypothetical protein
MNSTQEFRSAHSIQTGFCDNCNKPSGSKKCHDFIVAELIFQEEICCVGMVGYAYESV